jgi:hypothetical protein
LRLRIVIKAMDMSGLARVRSSCVHNKFHIGTITIKRFCWGRATAKGNVTVLSHLMLADFHPGQKGWARNILLVLANLDD